MSKKNENIIKATSPSGLKWTLDKRVADDWRLMGLIQELYTMDPTDKRPENLMGFFEKIKEVLTFIITGKILSDLEGEEKAEVNKIYHDFCNLVAANHGGFASSDAILEEYNFIMETLGIKNSKTSQSS